MAQRKIKVKPGKTQSKFGFAVGVVFVIIGCVVVIPTFGPFGIFWTIIAGFLAVSNFKNGFSDEGIATHEIIVEDNGNGAGIEEKLKTLESLYHQGLITQEEYDKKRKEVLEDF